MKPTRYIFLGLLTALLWTSAALAQVSTTGRLTGTVTDATGAVVPNAQITARSLET